MINGVRLNEIIDEIDQDTSGITAGEEIDNIETELGFFVDIEDFVKCVNKEAMEEIRGLPKVVDQERLRKSLMTLATEFFLVGCRVGQEVPK